MKIDLNQDYINEMNILIQNKKIDIEECSKALNDWEDNHIVRAALLFYRSESQYQLERYKNKLNTAAKELECIF
jgi:hypothetical protein